MKNPVIFVLVASIAWFGAPGLSIASSLPRPMGVQEKARLMSLNDPALLTRKGGEGIPGLPPPPPPTASNQAPQTVVKKGDDGFLPGFLVGIGATLAAEILLVIGSYHGGGSC